MVMISAAEEGAGQDENKSGGCVGLPRCGNARKRSRRRRAFVAVPLRFGLLPMPKRFHAVVASWCVEL